LSTHPNPENRVERTQARLAALNRTLDNTVTDREEYLGHLRGMTYGEDPRQGYFEGTRFYHPQLRFQLDFPEGWKTQNTPQAVVGVSQQQDAIVQLGLAGQTPPRQAAQQFLAQEGVRGGDASTASVNGNPAASSYFQAQTQQGNIEGLVSFISYGGTTYGILAYTGAGKLGSYDNAFRRAVNSFRELRDQTALSVQPARVELVKLSRETTLEQFNRQYPSTITVEELAIINEVEGPGSALPAGRTVKRVVGGRSAG
ncbi:MAG: M48 family metalloprotease, partial [Gemmatimonadales bacterium]